MLLKKLFTAQGKGKKEGSLVSQHAKKEEIVISVVSKICTAKYGLG